MNRLIANAIVLLCAGMTPAVAAPALKDCERILTQRVRQNQIAANVQAKFSTVAREPAAMCAFGKQSMPQLAGIIAEKRAVRSNSCWTPTDEAYYQRLLVVQQNYVRNVAAFCVAAKNPGAFRVVRYYYRSGRTSPTAKD